MSRLGTLQKIDDLMQEQKSASAVRRNEIDEELAALGRRLLDKPEKEVNREKYYIDEMKRMLKETDLSLSEISRRTGASYGYTWRCAQRIGRQKTS